MLFNTYPFWLFFAVVLPLYWSLDHRRQNWLLLAASYFFYGCWDWRFLFLLGLTTVVDYSIAHGIRRYPGRGRMLLGTSIVLNLGVLGFFKYYGFFTQQLHALLQAAGIGASLPVLEIILPVGISFYTFQEMSYVIDVYRGHEKPARNLLDFAVYVAFFPQLVAGPIERSTHLLPQVTGRRVLKEGDFAQGMYLVLLGMFAKVVVADNVANGANAVFGADPSELSGTECLGGIYCFALQIYGDFLGYSTIARGISKWMGFDLMLNFRMPYFATSPSDFWRRWHISLSTWLRDYLYIPLGGNRHGELLTYRNLMLTMVLGGLWHGAAWTFVLWGVFHGLILCLYRPFEKTRVQLSSGWWLLRVLIMFHLVCLGWLLFRAESLEQVATFLHLIATDMRMTPVAYQVFAYAAAFGGGLIALDLLLLIKDDVLAPLKAHWALRGALYGLLLVMLDLMASDDIHAFIYFQF